MLKEIIQKISIALGRGKPQEVSLKSIKHGFFVYEGELYFTANWCNFSCIPRELRGTFKLESPIGSEIKEEDLSPSTKVVVPRRVTLDPTYQIHEVASFPLSHSQTVVTVQPHLEDNNCTLEETKPGQFIAYCGRLGFVINRGIMKYRDDPESDSVRKAIVYTFGGADESVVLDSYHATHSCSIVSELNITYDL